MLSAGLKKQSRTHNWLPSGIICEQIVDRWDLASYVIIKCTCGDEMASVDSAAVPEMSEVTAESSTGGECIQMRACKA